MRGDSAFSDGLLTHHSHCKVEGTSVEIAVTEDHVLSGLKGACPVLWGGWSLWGLGDWLCGAGGPTPSRCSF